MTPIFIKLALALALALLNSIKKLRQLYRGLNFVGKGGSVHKIYLGKVLMISATYLKPHKKKYFNPPPNWGRVKDTNADSIICMYEHIYNIVYECSGVEFNKETKHN